MDLATAMLLSQGVGGALSAFNQGGARDDYTSLLAQAEQDKYDQDMAEWQAKNDYNASISPILAANAAARARAAAATEANRLAALKKAQKIFKRGFEKRKKITQPYVDTGLKLLPQMTSTYEKALGGMGGMADFFGGAKSQAAMDTTGVSAVNTDVGALPAYLRK